MAENQKADNSGSAFPIVTMEMIAHSFVFPLVEPGMTMRQYYAAHCPMTMSEAYEIWAGKRESSDPLDARFRDSMMSLGLRQGTERLGFFQWWALMRFEYADAMVAEAKGAAL